MSAPLHKSPTKSIQPSNASRSQRSKAVPMSSWVIFGNFFSLGSFAVGSNREYLGNHATEIEVAIRDNCTAAHRFFFLNGILLANFKMAGVTASERPVHIFHFANRPALTPVLLVIFVDSDGWRTDGTQPTTNQHSF